MEVRSRENRLCEHDSKGQLKECKINSCMHFQHFLGSHQNPLESAALMPVVPRREQPHIVLPGILFYECNYGPESNLTNKWKAMEHLERSRMWTTARLVYRSFRFNGDTKQSAPLGYVSRRHSCWRSTNM